MLYADDILLLYEANTEEEIMGKINSDRRTIVSWLDANRLIINVEETDKISTFSLSEISTNNPKQGQFK